MTTHSNQFPGLGSTSGSPAWDSPTRIEADDANLSFVPSGDMPDGQISGYLLATNFGFDAGANEVPAGSSIDGIKVYIKRYASRADMVDNVMSMWTGSAVGDNKADVVTGWPGAEAEVNYGGAADDWNASLDSTDVRASSFGVAFKCKNENGIFNSQPYANYIKIDLTFTEPPAADLMFQHFIAGLVPAVFGVSELGRFLLNLLRPKQRAITSYAKVLVGGA